MSLRGNIAAAACAALIAWPGLALASDAGPADAGVPSAGATADAGPAAGAMSGDAGVPKAGPPRDGGAGPTIPTPDGLPPGFEIPEAVASPSVEEVELGRPFSLFISVTHPPDVRVNLPTMIPSLRGAFDELRRTTGTSKKVDGTPVQEFELEVIPWVVGNLQIPPIELTYVVAGKVHRVRTKAVPLKVISVIGDGEEKLRDIVPPVDVKRRDWFLLWVLGALGICLIGGATAWRFRKVVWKRPRRRVRQSAAPVFLSAEAEALHKLDELEASGALDADDLKPLYVELSHITRRYLGRRYSFPALELTTREIRERLGHVSGGEVALGLMGEVLETADYVKYAGYGSNTDEARGLINTARGLVRGTPPAPPRPVPTAAPTPPTVAPTAAPGAAAVPVAQAATGSSGPGYVSVHAQTPDTLIDSSGPPADPAAAVVVPDAAAPPTLVEPSGQFIETLKGSTPPAPATTEAAAPPAVDTLIDSSVRPDAPSPVMPAAAAPPTLVEGASQTMKWTPLPGDDDEGDRDA